MDKKSDVFNWDGTYTIFFCHGIKREHVDSALLLKKYILIDKNVCKRAFIRLSRDPELMLQGKKSKNCFISPFLNSASVINCHNLSVQSDRHTPEKARVP